MRLFVGIALAAEVIVELAEVVERLRSSGDGLRWMEPQSWHITLQFLGNAEQDRYACLLARLGAVRSQTFSVRLEELGSFDRAGVFFAGVRAVPGLISLGGLVAEATAGCGFVADARPFHPHITLARAKGQDRGRALRAVANKVQRQPAFTEFVAREFLLYESHLSAMGASYEVRARFHLASGVEGPVMGSRPV